MKGGNEATNGSVVTLRRSPFKIGLNNIKKENAETADYSQNTQTDWECGDDANYVSFATIPVRFF